MGNITEVSKCGGDGKVGGVIPPPFSPSVMLDGCEYKNDDDDGDIYENDDVPNHDYRFEDGSLAGMGAGEGKSPAFDGGSDGRISDGCEHITHDDDHDDNNIDISNGLLPGHPHIATTGTSLGRIKPNLPPDICA